MQKEHYVYKGKLQPPKGELTKDWNIRNQLLFKSTEFGDDKDRPLQKSDKSWTYFAGDVAYHQNKINRNFDVLINILGADHAGYIKRISSVVEALSGDKNKFNQGEELYNLVATCLAFEQDVFLITKENSLLSLDLNNLRFVSPEEASQIIDKSDFYLEC